MGVVVVDEKASVIYKEIAEFSSWPSPILNDECGRSVLHLYVYFLQKSSRDIRLFMHS